MKTPWPDCCVNSTKVNRAARPRYLSSVSKVDAKWERKNCFPPVHQLADGIESIGRIQVVIWSVTTVRMKNQTRIPSCRENSGTDASLPTKRTVKARAMIQITTARKTINGTASVETEKSQATGAKPTRMSPIMAKQAEPRANV